MSVPDRRPVGGQCPEIRDMPNGDPALRTARVSFTPSSVIFGIFGPNTPGITSFTLGLLHIGQLIMYLSRAFTRYALPNSPYP